MMKKTEVNFHLGFAYSVLLLIAVCVVVIRVVDALSAERAIITCCDGQPFLAVRAAPNNKEVDDKCDQHSDNQVDQNHALNELISDAKNQDNAERYQSRSIAQLNGVFHT